MAPACPVRVTALIVVMATLAPAAPSAQTRAWPRLQVFDLVAQVGAREALDEAWALLAQPECVTLLATFHDASNTPLAHRLAQLSLDPQTYLTTVMFVDGSRETQCTEGVFAFTSPGSRVVRLCAGELKRLPRFGPRQTAARIIHEMLHTLGLGEDPPSSKEITQRVLAACHR